MRTTKLRSSSPVLDSEVDSLASKILTISRMVALMVLAIAPNFSRWLKENQRLSPTPLMMKKKSKKLI